MSILKEADFYYGAVLSTLINRGICPALVESGEDRQIYDFVTNQYKNTGVFELAVSLFG